MLVIVSVLKAGVPTVKLVAGATAMVSLKSAEAEPGAAKAAAPTKTSASMALHETRRALGIKSLPWD
jgi:hypothetical protein